MNKSIALTLRIKCLLCITCALIFLGFIATLAYANTPVLDGAWRTLTPPHLLQSALGTSKSSLPDEEVPMQHHYSIARQETGENFIRIDIDLDDDGSLTMSDYCRGPAAEQCFGCEDIESIVTLSPESVRNLYEALTGLDSDDPASDLALLVQANKRGDTSAQTWLRSECDQLGIQFKWHH